MFRTHFDGKRFFNPDSPPPRGLLDVIRWKLTSRAEPSPERLDDVRPGTPPERVTGETLRITVVNHSTVLIQQVGANLLTDPIWSERASPVPWAGPKRKRAPGVAWSDLPAIDAVLLSHNHYDHLDLPTLRRLAGRGSTQFVVPAGLLKMLTSNGIDRVLELDWGESASVGPVTVHCIPAVHFSARSVLDRNKTLWCGYVLQAPAGPVYFAGDTAFGDHFAQIRKDFGRPRAALLPIGAYLPRWFMSAVHMSPDEAVKAAEILEPDASVAIHHGTFQLADDGVDTPAKRLRDIPGGEIIRVLRNGEVLQLP